ncbi:hypothetical protein HPB52_024073 [Rhipicephalus sanguineus]|uniref:CCHC-type domain-containing protein n=1 Tax=Rhipicephalus sanguineus TaxID=34632 RepID=A0A9D4PPF5_RHISA|nr:hypothetical protein HPB52_024073 [Rhipicephalus sanguineus]
MDNVIVPKELVQYLIYQTDGSPIQCEQVASLLWQRVMAATVMAGPPLAQASPPAARGQQPNTQFHCQCCGGISHVGRHCAKARQNVPPMCFQCGQQGHMQAECPENGFSGNRHCVLQVATTAGQKEPLFSIRIGATTFQAPLDTWSSASDGGH